MMFMKVLADRNEFFVCGEMVLKKRKRVKN